MNHSAPSQTIGGDRIDRRSDPPFENASRWSPNPNSLMKWPTESLLSLFTATLILLGALVSVRTTAAAGPDGLHFVPDVVGQFNALTVRPDPLGFYIGNSPDPSSCKHYQGMVRIQAADGTPYLLVTRSGNDPEQAGCVDPNDPGNLLVVRMESRDKNGERMRSNRLRRGRNLTSTPPDRRDDTVAFFTFDGQGIFPSYGHPGGMQAVGNMVAIALEFPYGGNPAARFLFIDVANPEQPVVRSSFDPPAGVKSGLVGITPLANNRYLMVVTGGKNETLWFFESLPTDCPPEDWACLADGPTDLSSQALSWVLKDEWHPSSGSEDKAYLEHGWPTDPAHQTLHFLREGDINGALYLAGARGKFAIGNDLMELYRVDFAGDQIRLKHMSSSHKNAHPNADPSFATPGNNTANFAAASTFYVSPSGELIFYCTEHDNDGWFDTSGGPLPGSGFSGGTVKAGEWRHIDMVRPGSSTLLPTLELFPPYQVTEGGSTVLTGFGRPPITRPWIQLFTDPDYSGRYVVVDFADWGKDDFDDFKDLDGTINDTHFGFDNEPSSWRWFAPKSCTIRANDDDFGDENFPGEFTRTLHGTGAPERDSDLYYVPNDSRTGGMNDELTSVQFFADCGTYYSTFPEISWDTDRNGSFETSGYIADFSAAGLDGPGEVSVPVQSRHPFDGLTNSGVAVVHVINVAPTMSQMTISDSLGNVVGTTVPFVLQGLPVTVAATFTDPGMPDHQTAMLSWGDNVTEADSTFYQFSDAFGGVVGQLAHHHIYSLAGDFMIELSLADDDDGVDEQAALVRVLAPADAVEEIIGYLDQVIAGAPVAQLKALTKARQALAGSVQGFGNNGALDKLRTGETQAALVKLREAIDYLHNARALGANVDTLISLLQQVMAAVEAQG